MHKAQLLICTAFFLLSLQSCGESKFSQWGKGAVDDLINPGKKLDDSEYKVRKMEKARKRMERQQEKNMPEGLKKYKNDGNDKG